MKEIKDKFITSDSYYFVLGYLDKTRYQPIFDRHLEWYEEGDPFPKWGMSECTFETFKELLEETVKYNLEHCEDITEETIDKYAEK